MRLRRARVYLSILTIAIMPLSRDGPVAPPITIASAATLLTTLYMSCRMWCRSL